jgi:hypothetical protein
MSRSSSTGLLIGSTSLIRSSALALLMDQSHPVIIGGDRRFDHLGSYDRELFNGLVSDMAIYDQLSRSRRCSLTTGRDDFRDDVSGSGAAKF